MEKNIILEECFAENNQFLPDILDVGMGGGVSYLHFNYLFQSIMNTINFGYFFWISPFAESCRKIIFLTVPLVHMQ